MLERSKDPRVQKALFGDGTNLGNRQRIWRKALVQLEIIQRIEGTENLYEPGPCMYKLSEYLGYRVEIADQRLALTDNGDVVKGRRARPKNYDADVSASGDTTVAMDTDESGSRAKTHGLGKESFPSLPSSSATNREKPPLPSGSETTTDGPTRVPMATAT